MDLSRFSGCSSLKLGLVAGGSSSLNLYTFIVIPGMYTYYVRLEGFNPLSRWFTVRFAGRAWKRRSNCFVVRSTCTPIYSPPSTSTPTTRLLMPDASAKNVQLIGSVLERTPGSAPPSLRSAAPKTGFPPVEHRTKSAFARSRDLSKKSTPNDERPTQPPIIIPERPNLQNDPPPSASDESKWREDISRENERIVANMSPEELELERQAILERFGVGVGAILQRARQNRGSGRNEQEGMAPERESERVPPGMGSLWACTCASSCGPSRSAAH